MQSREVVGDRFTVLGPDGRTWIVQRIDTVEHGRLMGSSGPSVTRQRYVRDDGAQLRGFIGGEQFVLEDTGEVFRRVK